MIKMIPQEENGIIASFNLWWWCNVIVMCCISITFPVYLIITNMSVSCVIVQFLYQFILIFISRNHFPELFAPRRSKNYFIFINVRFLILIPSFNQKPFMLSVHEMCPYQNISNTSRIKRMLPFKRSTLYKVEPRRDFVVKPKQVKRSRGSVVQKMTQFYDIEQNVF